MSGHRDRRVPALIALASVLGLALVVVAVLLVRERNAGTEVVEPARASSTSTTEATSTTVPVRRPSGSEVPGRIDGGKVEGGVRIQTGYIADGVLQRPYLVYSPADADPVERLPMVMVLHGRGVTSQQMAREVDWKSAVATDRFVAVFPQGVLDSWNAGPCCPPASALGTNDVGFLDRVVAAVSERPDVDSARRYLTGFSNGGIMTYEMACERSEEFAAYGLPNWFMLLVGTMKISAALLLIAGIWFPALVLPAASTVAVLMVGAVLMHIRVRDPWSKSVPATMVLALCLVIVLLPSLPSPPLQ